MMFLLLFLYFFSFKEANLTTLAQEMQRELSERTLPYWFDTAQDPIYGGYLLNDREILGKAPPIEKQLVTQSRMIWTFSHASLAGFDDAHRNYLKGAEQGVRFLMKFFLDRTHGGFFWSTDLKGNVTNPQKFLYGQAFVIFALAEYYRASKDEEALHSALALYHTLQTHLYDSQNGGWFEQAAQNWAPLPSGDPRNLFHHIFCKTANTHLHWMEALTELYDVSQDVNVRKSLIEVLRLNKTYFWPAIPKEHSAWKQIDWSQLPGGGISYGHNVEFAHLMIRAEKALGLEPSWDRFYALLNHTLQHGFDPVLGGVYKQGFEDQPACDLEKIWWAQAEMLAALTDALQQRKDPLHEKALKSLLYFIKTYQMSPKDGIWLTSVTADGKPKDTSKADSWKANYHDVRAMIKFTQSDFSRAERRLCSTTH